MTERTGREPKANAAESTLVRALGTWMLAAAIINVTVGGGIFRLPANVAGSLGAAAPLAYMVCAVALGLIVMCFADAGSRVSLTGGPYAYVEVAFGPFIGFIAGFLLWMLGTFAMAAVSTVFAVNVAQLIPALQGGVRTSAFLIAVYAVLTLVNIRGVVIGARLNTVTTVAKLFPLLLLVIVGAFFIKPANLAWTRTPSAAEVSRTSILLIFAFSGVECALVPSGEVKDPSRTVPRAIFTAMLGITLLYIALQLVAQGVLGADLATATAAPLADTASRSLGTWGRTLLLVGATVSMFGYVSGMTLAVPRAIYAFGRDGFLPGVFGRIHPRYRTPHVAIVVQSVIVCLLAVTSTFEKLAIISNLSVLLLYALCCLAAWELRRRDVRSGGIPFRVPAAGVIPFAAVAVIAWMLTSIQLNEWAALGIALVVAVAMFVVTRGHRAALVAETP
jgi:APA family basic amino acid/polyamine antiporter